MTFAKSIAISCALGLAITSFSPLANAAQAEDTPIIQNNTGSVSSTNELGNVVLEDGKSYQYSVSEEANGNETIVFSNPDNTIEAFYDKEKGEIWVDGVLEVYNIVNDETQYDLTEQPSIQTRAVKEYNIGDKSNGSGIYDYISTDQGSFNLANLVVASVAAVIVVALFKKKPTQATLTGLAGTIVGALAPDRFQVNWRMYHYKDSKIKYRWQDSILFHKNPDRKAADLYARANHYYGEVN